MLSEKDPDEISEGIIQKRTHQNEIEQFEGLTEFAPVSSTGHMILVDDILFKTKEIFSEPVANTFKVCIQLGSILAVVIVFKDRILDLLGLKRKGSEEGEKKDRLTLGQIFVGLLPAAVLWFPPLHDSWKSRI